MSGYTGKPSSHTSLVETTFLLCKPGAQHLHRTLLQLVADAGFRVQAKSFTMTPAVADVIARTFPSVKESRRRGSPARDERTGSDATGSNDTDQQQTAKSLGVTGTGTTLLEEHVRFLCSRGPCLAMALSAANAVNQLLAMVGPEDPVDARRMAPTSLRAMYGGDDVVHNTIHACANLADASLCIRATFGYETPSLASAARSTAAALVAAAAGNREEDDASHLVATNDAARVVESNLHGGSPGQEEALFTAARPDIAALRLSPAGADPLTLADLLQRAPQELALLRGTQLAASPPTPSNYATSPASSVVTPQRLQHHLPRYSDARADSFATSSAAVTAEWLRGDGALTRQQLAEAWEALVRQQEQLRVKELDVFLR